MGLKVANRPRLIASLVVLGFVAILTSLVIAPANPFGFGDMLQRASYDSLHMLGPERSISHSPVFIVYLDLQSYQDLGQDPGRPLPRELHAKLIQQLTGAGADAVVFDIVFAGPGADPNGDQKLTEAIRQNGHVILAGEKNDKQTHGTSGLQPDVRILKIEPPFTPFANAAAGWGLIEQHIDDDFGIRQYFSGTAEQPSLTWRAAQIVNASVAHDPAAIMAANGNWLRYYGPPLTIPHTSFAQALSGDTPPEHFHHKIVFVGARAIVQGFQGRTDEFRSPFHSWGNRELFMPGVEVHATEMLNLVRGDWLRKIARGTLGAILILVAVTLGGGLVWLRPIPATLVALLAAAATLGLSIFGFTRGVWFPWVIVCGVQIPAALGGSILYQSVEWLRARRRFEAARRHAEAKIREQAALIDKAHDAIFVQDLNGRILYNNPSAERLYGWTSSELQHDGLGAKIISPDADNARVAREAALCTGEWDGELRQQTRTGQIVTVASRWTLIRDDTGQPRALLIINSDITEKKALEAQFLRTQRMNTIGSLAGGMAHDLNNALAPILLGVQLLRRKTSDDESAQLLSLMESSTHRSADMVRQVLLFARGRGSEVERLELGPLIKEIEQIVRETFPRNIGIDTFLPRDLWAVSGNPTQLHQVLLNLCVNARDAMPQGGHLSFAADNVALTEVEAREIPEAQAGDYVSLLVSDTGTGIPPEIKARIFEPFFTTKGEGRGTGIGLSTVLRIVKSHHGFIRVESERGQGTTFEILLPRARVSETVPSEATITAAPRGQGELILVADDERAIRELLTLALEGHGYGVLSCSTGDEAVRLFRQNALAVRLLLTDSSMPGMTGLQAAAQIRKLNPGLPVIMGSGEPATAADSPMPNSDALPEIVHISKPFSLDEVLAAISHSLHSPEQERTT